MLLLMSCHCVFLVRLFLHIALGNWEGSLWEIGHLHPPALPPSPPPTMTLFFFFLFRLSDFRIVVSQKPQDLPPTPTLGCREITTGWLFLVALDFFIGLDGWEGGYLCAAFENTWFVTRNYDQNYADMQMRLSHFAIFCFLKRIWPSAFFRSRNLILINKTEKWWLESSKHLAAATDAYIILHIMVYHLVCGNI